MMSDRIRGALLTLLGGSCWGLCAVSAKYMVSESGVDPAWIVSLRLIISGAVLLIVDLVRRHTGDKRTALPGFTDIWKRRETVIRLILVAVFAFAVCQTTYFMSVGYSNAGVGAAIQQTAPIFVLAYTVLIGNRKPGINELLSLIIVMAGVFLLATHGDPGTLVIAPVAIIWGLVSAVTCACYTIMPEPLVREFGTYNAVGWGMLTAGLLLVPVCRLWIPSGTWTGGTVLAFAYIVTLGTIVAFACFLYGITLIGSLKGSIYALIEPVVAAFMSIIILGQKYVPADYAGIMLIICGVIYLTVTGKRTEQQTPVARRTDRK